MIQAYRDFVTKAPRRSPLWRKTRKAYLNLHPHCEACGRKLFVAVHHIIPYHIDPSRELDMDNLITMCRGCHITLAHLRNWRSWNREIRRDAERLLKKIRERP